MSIKYIIFHRMLLFYQLFRIILHIDWKGTEKELCRSHYFTRGVSTNLLMKFKLFSSNPINVCMPNIKYIIISIWWFRCVHYFPLFPFHLVFIFMLVYFTSSFSHFPLSFWTALHFNLFFIFATPKNDILYFPLMITMTMMILMWKIYEVPKISYPLTEVNIFLHGVHKIKP